jgi:Fe-S-cluster containining protein
VSKTGTCKRCGTCCQQGGPALHGPDLELLRAGHLNLDDLITVRRGELAFQPLAACPEPVRHEFLKMKGQNSTWCCAYYDEATKGCRRYAHRPLACGVLDCTDTGPLLAIAGQDLLTRFDCITPDDPLLPHVRRHEEDCPCPDMQTIRRDLEQDQRAATLLAELEAAVNRDLAFRSSVTADFRLSLAQELFYFGRPLFQLLLPLGMHAVNTPAGIRLNVQVRSTRPAVPDGQHSID